MLGTLFNHDQQAPDAAVNPPVDKRPLRGLFRTLWQSHKNRRSDRLLVRAVFLLPVGSPERRELAEFLKGYLERGLERLEASVDKEKKC